VSKGRQVRSSTLSWTPSQKTASRSNQNLRIAPAEILMEPFWISIYGLMIFLPVYSLPAERDTPAPRWFDIISALLLPLAGAIVMALIVSRLSAHLPHFGPQLPIRDHSKVFPYPAKSAIPGA
jgi:hypothetical protein